MSEKAKNEPQKNTFLNRISFLFLWIVSSVGIGLATNSFLNWLIYFIPQTFGVSISELTSPAWRLGLVFTLVHSLILSSVQAVLLGRGFGRRVKGWVWASLVGGVLSSLPLILISQLNLQGIYENNVNLFYVLATLLYTLPQVWVLRRYVQKAWLLPLIAIPTNLLAITLTMYGFTNRLNLEPIASLITATVMALLMLWFFRDTPIQEKAKLAEAESHERLEDGMESEDGLEDIEMRQEKEQAQ
jgi:magnesium-transporting ATPase (P-type)